MKLMNNPKEMRNQFKNEIYFCENFFHRCLTHFYGFLIENNEKIGFIYEFMSNDSLSSIISSQNHILSESFNLFIINRIFQGIKYLHSNCLVHRDIKSSNILFNHDFIPFISDFETIIHPSEDEETTINIGSNLYISPEQFKGEFVTYSSDIYSFGLIIYHLVEKKHLQNLDFLFDYSNIYRSISKMSINNNIKELCLKCTKYLPSERITNDEIQNILIKESNKFYYDCLLSTKTFDISQFIIETVKIQVENQDELKKCFENILHSLFISLNGSDKKYPEFLFSVGLSYYKIQKYLKAKKYFEYASEKHDSNSFLFLGNLYFNGYGVNQDYLKAKEYYELSAKENNIEAFNNLGNIYYNGFGVEKNYLKARKYYELSASQNNSDAICNLGSFYYYGYDVKQDYSKAKEYFELSAKQNNSDAFNYLGNIYKYGYGVKQDYSKAKEYYELAAKQNNSYALNNLGNLYKNGIAVKKDYKKAKEYYELAAKQNNSYAYYNLGTLYYNGYGVKQDYLKAKEYFEISAKQNNNFALNSLGNYYKHGYIAQKDYKKAREYYELAAENGSKAAYNNLGTLYEYGFGVKQDYSKAKEYYELSGNSFALYYLGNLYFYGLGVEKNIAKAKEYYVLSSNKNNLYALNSLGRLHKHGIGIPKDYLGAKYYFEKSAQQNNSFALINLGNLYKHGYGVKKDFNEAKKYYELSYQQGNNYAMNKLGNLYKNGYGVEQNYSKAKELYTISASNGNSDALLYLAEFYYHGYGVKQNSLLALDYYKLAAEKNNPDALFYLGYIYSTGDDVFNIDIFKSINYLLKCINIINENIEIRNSKNNVISYKTRFNKYRYRSYNDLGLIYITIFQDIEKADCYLKEAAFAEYPFGQNSFGLLNEFYLNQPGNAKYMYKRSSKHNFALAEFNLARIKEKDNKIEKSIKYYSRCSEHEDESLKFHNHIHHDKRLEISKIFIICLANMKLVEYHFIQSNYEEAKKFFSKAFSKIKLNDERLSYKFLFQFNEKNNGENIFSYLKKYIINFPLFNLNNQPNLSIDLDQSFVEENQRQNELYKKAKEIENNDHLEYESKETEQIIEKCFNNDIFEEEKKLKKNRNISSIKMIENKSFEDPISLFHYTINANAEIKSYFINEIRDIIDTLNEILYNPPYLILFGRINIVKRKPERKSNRFLMDINELFYEGFSINNC
ncbi:Interleukin-1 receptor-associated kinase 4 [Tritrichomonas musculus]|uniref:Interleukin-1 receptor-associated kinase 4 n=1 Tax=Tritrichomonas musculus TaxID=1915356 RepID=A0ABR2GWJ3_9EUKA